MMYLFVQDGGRRHLAVWPISFLTSYCFPSVNTVLLTKFEYDQPKNTLTTMYFCFSMWRSLPSWIIANLIFILTVHCQCK